MPRLLLIAERCPPDIGGSEVFPQPKILNLKYSGSQKSEVCPMPYALCPMPYAQSYLIFLRKAIDLCWQY